MKKAFKDLQKGDIVIIKKARYEVMTIPEPIDDASPNGLWKTYFERVSKWSRHFEYPNVFVNVS